MIDIESYNYEIKLLKTKVIKWFSVCSHFHPSKGSFSDRIGMCHTVAPLHLCRELWCYSETIGSGRLSSTMSSILKCILADSSINFYFFKSLALKLEHTWELSGGLVKMQVAGPCPQNLSIGQRWGQEFAFLLCLQIILRQLVKEPQFEQHCFIP